MNYGYRLRRGPFDPPPAQEEEVDGVVFVGARVMNDNGQNVAPGSANVILDTVIYEIGATFWTVGDPTALVAPSDGYYELSATIEFGDGDGTFRQVLLSIQGQSEDPYGYAKGPPIAGTSTSVHVARTSFMEAGDKLIVSVSHDASTDINVTGSTGIVKVGEA